MSLAEEKVWLGWLTLFICLLGLQLVNGQRVRFVFYFSARCVNLLIKLFKPVLTKENILRNVGVQTTLSPIEFDCMVQNLIH